MKNSQHIKPTPKGENVYKNSKCPCPGNQEFTRKSNRTALGEIQDSANKNQYLSQDYSQGTSYTRSKSLSVYSPGPLSLSCTPIRAESTRIEREPPAFKQPLLKFTGTPTVCPPNKAVSKGPLVPVRTRSSSYRSCPCSGSKNAASVDSKKENARFSTDPVSVVQTSTGNNNFLHPSIPASKNRSEYGQSVKITSSNQNSASHHNQHSMPSALSQGTIVSKTKQSTQQYSEEFVPWINPVILSSSSKQRSGCSSTKSISKILISTPNSTSKTSQNSAATKGCCSASSTAKTSSSQPPILAQTHKYLPHSQPQNQVQQELDLAYHKQVSTGLSTNRNRGDQGQTVKITSSDQNLAPHHNRHLMPLALSESSSISISKVEIRTPNSTSKTSQNLAASKRNQGCCSASSTAKSSSSKQSLLSQNHKYLPDNQLRCQESRELNLAHSKAVSTSISTSKNRSEMVKLTSSHQSSISHDKRSSMPFALPRSNSTAISETEISTQSGMLQNLAAKNQNSCPGGSTTKTNGYPSMYATLPSQQFVTLSQDTLQTTVGCDGPQLSLQIDSALDKVKLVRDSSLFAEEEKSFLDGPEYFQDLDQGKCPTVKTMPIYSPLKTNVPIRRSNSLSDESGSTRRVKSTLRRTSSIKKVIVYPLVYSPEYIEDIISYAYKQRTRFLLKSEWIEGYVDKRYRTITLNWLLEVREIILPHCNSVYYTAVRIFDYAVIKLRLRKISYPLAAIVAFWMSLKYLDSSVLLKIPKIYSLCSGQYSKEEILSLERTMLKSIHFCLNMSDPLDFLNYYLKSANLEQNEVLRFGSKFVLECATLFETYATAEAPLMAASALYLAYKILLNTTNIYVNFIWLDRKSVRNFADGVLLANVQYVIMNQYEPFNKYLTADKLKVAKEFYKILI